MFAINGSFYGSDIFILINFSDIKLIVQFEERKKDNFKWVMNGVETFDSTDTFFGNH